MLYHKGDVNRKVEDFKRKELERLVYDVVTPHQRNTFLKVYGEPRTLIGDSLDNAIHNVEKWIVRNQGGDVSAAVLLTAVAVMVASTNFDSTRR